MINNFADEYDFLSNFYVQDIPINVDGIIYYSVEAAFQASKTLDLELRLQIAKCTPGQSKREGRKLLLREDWDIIKNDVMLQCLREKFKITSYWKKLQDTGGHFLLEGNTWHDNYWGNCNCLGCRNRAGENVLGKLLMKVRHESRAIPTIGL